MSFIDVLKGEQLRVFERYAQSNEFPIGSQILREGDPGDGCYVIDEGTVRLELQSTETDADGVIGFLDAGALLGEFGLVDGLPRSASAFAHTDVTARWFSRASLDEICYLYPHVGLTITRTLGQTMTAKVRGLVEQIAGYVFAGEIDRDTHEMVGRAVNAQKSFADTPEDRMDALLRDVAEALAAEAEALGKETVDETGLGVAEHKAMKIRFACLEVLRGLLGATASGQMDAADDRVIRLASPVGVILGLIPLTNPVSTIAFKSLISLKGRNSLILSCHRGALGVGNRATDIIRSVLETHGAPADLVQSIRERTSRRKTMMFMNHPNVSLILATGGTSMVRAAYSSGTPAIGVGSGNAPVLICGDADLSAAAAMIVESKSFDNGVICGSENNLVVVESARDEFVYELEAHGAIVLRPDEKSTFTEKAFDFENSRVRRDLIGKSAGLIAAEAGLGRSGDFRLIVVPVRPDELDGPYGHEKLAPILSMVEVAHAEAGIWMCKRVLESQGRGHTAVIHTRDVELARRFGREIDASRILVNVASSQGCIGIGTGLTPSFTLGCGTFGGNSTTDNVSFTHLLNIKRLAIGVQP
jgi:acyl-CoA reductase-like NAD-dependent aldehyde dehydrogenase